MVYFFNFIIFITALNFGFLVAGSSAEPLKADAIKSAIISSLDSALAKGFKCSYENIVSDENFKKYVSLINVSKVGKQIVRTSLDDDTGIEGDYSTIRKFLQTKDLKPKLKDYFLLVIPQLFGLNAKTRLVKISELLDEDTKKVITNNLINPDDLDKVLNAKVIVDYNDTNNLSVPEIDFPSSGTNKISFNISNKIPESISKKINLVKARVSCEKSEVFLHGFFANLNGGTPGLFRIDSKFVDSKDKLKSEIFIWLSGKLINYLTVTNYLAVFNTTLEEVNIKKWQAEIKSNSKSIKEILNDSNSQPNIALESWNYDLAKEFISFDAEQLPQFSGRFIFRAFLIFAFLQQTNLSDNYLVNKKRFTNKEITKEQLLAELAKIGTGQFSHLMNLLGKYIAVNKNKNEDSADKSDFIRESAKELVVEINKQAKFKLSEEMSEAIFSLLASGFELNKIAIEYTGLSKLDYRQFNENKLSKVVNSIDLNSMDVLLKSLLAKYFDYKEFSPLIETSYYKGPVEVSAIKSKVVKLFANDNTPEQEIAIFKDDLQKCIDSCITGFIPEEKKFTSNYDEFSSFNNLLNLNKILTEMGSIVTDSKLESLAMINSFIAKYLDQEQSQFMVNLYDDQSKLLTDFYMKRISKQVDSILSDDFSNVNSFNSFLNEINFLLQSGIREEFITSFIFMTPGQANDPEIYIEALKSQGRPLQPVLFGLNPIYELITDSLIIYNDPVL